MKITYFRLKGYINILNGMGLDEIIIPFNTFKNRIVLISGANGTGKSTLVSTMSPDIDGSDSFRTDVFMDNGFRQIVEYPAEKEIHYVDEHPDGTVDEYAILIQSIVNEARTKRTTKAYISKNGEEMNPNGNVQSFRDIRDSLLGIDPVYLDLSSISAENRGIVDMIPSERRKYMAAYIGSLDTYNNIFKTLSKKVSNLKSYMNTLNSKIYEIGDENELRIKLVQLETNLKEVNTERDNILKELSEAETTVKIIDPNNEMQDLYVSISERLGNINSEIVKNESSLVYLCSTLKVDKDNHDFQELLIENSNARDSYQKTYDENKNKISSLIGINEITQNAINEDKLRLESISNNKVHDNIEKAINDIKSDIDIYESYLIDSHMKIFDKISLEDLNSLKEVLDKFAFEVRASEELGSEEEFIAACNLVENFDEEEFIKNYKNKYRDEINSNNDKISENERKITNIKEDLEIIKSFDTTRPAECKIDTCPYIAKYIKIKESGIQESDIKVLEDEIVSLRSINRSIELLDNKSTVILAIIRRLKNALATIYANKNSISKIEDLSFLLDFSKLKEKLESHNRFYEFSIVDNLIEEFSIYDDLKRYKEQYKDLESDLKIYNSNKIMIDSLEASISKNEKEYAEREEEIKSLSKDCNFLSGLIEELDRTIENINKAIENETNLNNLRHEKEDLKKEFESVKDNIKLVKTKVDQVNLLRNELSKKEEMIEPLTNSINQIRFNLANIVSYQQEYKESSDMYDKVSFIRNACSPGNGMGIQSEYIKRYMNDIIIDCNTMLSYMFNGQIQLDVPIINENQFSIPFIGPGGIPVPDISNGSTAQKCMIGLVFSCVAMMKSSTKYNIPRFDEIDGGLDQANRITFITVLNQILDFMGSDQCIICSHNTEFDAQSTTRILCYPGGIKIVQ